MNTFTLFHVALSLVGILSGLVVAAGFLSAKLYRGWNTLFLVTTVATSVTGFFFPFHGFTPAIGVGIVSLVALAVAIVALCVGRVGGAWRWLYVVSAMLALYFNVFVLVVQAFQKVSALNALAPTQSEPPFAIAQGLTLVVFIAWGIRAVLRFRPGTANAT